MGDGVSANSQMHDNMCDHIVCRVAGVTSCDVQGCMHAADHGNQGLTRCDRMQRWREMWRHLHGCISDGRSDVWHGCMIFGPRIVWYVEEMYGEATDESRV